MQTATKPFLRPILHSVGSLWFGAVLLIVVLLAMACGTIFESQQGTEQALWVFYRAWWFKALLGLLALNILASILVRYPFSLAKAGFLLTHGSILLLLGGAVITQFWGIDGQLGFAEGETISTFAVGENVVEITNTRTGEKKSIDLRSALGSGFSSVDDIDAESPTFGDLTFSASRFFPDTDYQELIEEGDAGDPRTIPAIRVGFGDEGSYEPSWLMLGRPKRVGVATGLYRMIGDEELTRLIASEAPDRGPTLGMVEIDYAGDTFEIDVAKAMKTPLRVSDTNAFVEVLRYIPHANVEPGGEVVSVSPDPINPAVEVVVSIGEKTHTQIAFARFPGFKSQHGGGDDADFDVRYVLPKTLKPRAPIEVFRNGDGELFVRFAWQGTSPVTQRVVVGEPIETPWPGKTLVVQDVLEHARVQKQLAEVSPVRDNRIPAVRIVASGPSGEKSIWVRRRMPSEMKIDGTPFRLSFGDRIVPLAFKVTLDRFRVRYYPGTRRPRSFESQITFTDPSSGLSQARIISMNHPTSFGGYTLYQSSYAMNPGEPAISYLSIARDPGLPFVFAGYIGTMIGMLIVLITRAKQQKQRSANRLAVAGDHQAQHSATRSPRSQRESVLVSPGQGVYQKGVTGNGNGEIDLLGRAAPCQR